MKTILALLLMSLVAMGAVPSQTDFDSTYFLTSSLPISVTGNLTNWQKLATNVTASTAMTGTVSNNVVSAGLLSVDATKTNGIAATAAHIISTLGFTPANSNSVPASANPTATVATTAVNGSAATFMRSDASPAIPASFITANQTNVVAANPTASVGSSVVNGSAATFMRSDAAPALAAGAATNNIGFVPVNKSGDAMTGPLNVPPGANSAVSIGFGGVTNTGWYYGSPNTWFSTAGTTTHGVASDSSFRVTSTGHYSWCSSSSAAGTEDLMLYRDSQATLQLGVDAASPVAQTIKAADGSGTDKSGGNFTHEGGQSTGTGTAGFFDIATGLTGEASGSSANAYSIRAHYKPKFVALTHTTATTIETFSLAANKLIGGTATVTCYATNSTPHLQALTSTLIFQAVAVSTTITATLSQVDGTTAADSGTLTCTYTIADNGDNTFSIKANANSSLSSPTERAKVVITALNGNAAISITDP